MKFTESKLEQVFVRLLERQGIAHIPGATVKRNSDEVLIEADLREYLLNRYREEKLTDYEATRIIQELKNLPASELYESNKAVMKKISDGFILKREDRTRKDLYIELIDYSGLTEFHQEEDNLSQIIASEAGKYEDYNNSYKLVTQLEITGNAKRIPDAILYINGLPIIVFEFKSAIAENCTIYDAYRQLTIRYRRDIPELFKFNAFCIISDGVNNKAGSFFAPYEFFYAWRRTDAKQKGSVESLETETINQINVESNNVSNKSQQPDNAPVEIHADGIPSLFTMVSGMLNRRTTRDIIRNFIFFPDSSYKEEKILCRYPQYYGAKQLFDSAVKNQKPEGSGKGGTYFGATGCGKSYTMLFLTRLLMRSKHFASPTIVLITDRNDLDDQLASQFTNAKVFIGDSNIISVETRAELRQWLQGIRSGGVFLTTIQKFSEGTELLTDRSNVICISDEAHRSQVNLDQKIKVTSAGVVKSFGFAKYLHDSLPNAIYVGFTGTPVDATLNVFGEIVDAYTMFESVEDEITVRIVYEGRAAKVVLNNCIFRSKLTPYSGDIDPPSGFGLLL